MLLSKKQISSLTEELRQLKVQKLGPEGLIRLETIKLLIQLHNEEVADMLERKNKCQ